MKITEKVRNFMRSFLRIQEAQTTSFNIQESMNYETNV